MSAAEPCALHYLEQVFSGIAPGGEAALHRCDGMPWPRPLDQLRERAILGQVPCRCAAEHSPLSMPSWRPNGLWRSLERRHFFPQKILLNLLLGSYSLFLFGI